MRGVGPLNPKVRFTLLYWVAFMLTSCLVPRPAVRTGSAAKRWGKLRG